LGKVYEAEVDLNQVLHYRKIRPRRIACLAKVSQGRANIANKKRQLQEALNIDLTFLAARIDLARSLLDEALENQMKHWPSDP
jgi:hypothetical protein